MEGRGTLASGGSGSFAGFRFLEKEKNNE